MSIALSTDFVNLFYGKLGRPLSLLCLLGALVMAAGALTWDPDLWVGAAVAGGYGGLLALATFMWKTRVRGVAGLDRENPLKEALLVLDWIEMGRLAELAAQKGVLPSPTRRERSRGRKVGAGVKGGTGGVLPAAEYETSTGEVVVYELPENRAQLLKDLISSLIEDEQIELAIADIPRISADAPLDERAMEALLTTELGERTSPPDLRTLVREVTEILGRGLPPGRLAASKEEELDRLAPGSYALLESEWSVSSSNAGFELTLAKLHPAGSVTASEQIEVPNSIEVKATLPKDGLSPRGVARMQSQAVQAGLFAEILSSEAGHLELWPIVAFTRTPSAKR